MRAIKFIACFALSLATGPAFAAPFCVDVTGIPSQCLYVDPTQCQREADRQGGRCSANPAEFLTQSGTQPFCMVESGNAVTCAYPDRASCDTDSRRRTGAVCIAAMPSSKPPPAVDPYELKRPY